MKKISAVICLLVLSCAISRSWGESAKPDQIQAMLSSVPAAEIPAKAAELIKQTKGREQSGMTVRVVKAALDMNPAAAPALVGAICRAVPEMAALAAGTAAEHQPKQASLIARAAAAAAPTKVGKIVVAVCKAVPNDYQNIALAVNQVAPAASKEIIEAIASAIPGTKAIINQVLSASGGNVPSLAYALNQINATPQPASSGGIISAPRGPAVGPPYIPLSGTPGNVNPTNSGVVPEGGRGYAAP